ncbi:MAG TPA: bifunctional DNA-formamidopyrimidine glycosylase/DNA-(apurinic or apyrimidinic site) lyase [Terriglobales bacterium]|nr:bifunctional DNA-formamidopyrimidine glycosylase/DNA-(apurinic or apyrimidinic site) lyase [Terriglobales bacterium]
MPELPEVETIARGLAQRVRGDRIESVWLGSKPEPLKSPAVEIQATLERARIAGVRRVGKHIVFDLDSEGARRQWIVHLGMTGRLLVARPESELPKHTHAVLRLASGRELRFVDPRRFGRLSVVHEEFAPDGHEPMDIGFELFAGLFRRRKTPVKSALLNQKLLRGVGNIYADESLFRAGVRPRRHAGRLTRQELRRLYKALQRVLNQAIKAGGSSISDYVDAGGEEGLFQFQHRVYGREGEPCLVCKTAIKRVVIAGRSAHYCPNCQS